jgi:hypothetical protein
MVASLQEKFKEIYDPVAVTQSSQDDSVQLTPEEIEQIRAAQIASFEQATGGLNRKKRSYGFGSKARSTQSSSSATSPQPADLPSPNQIRGILEHNARMEKELSEMRGWMQYMFQSTKTKPPPNFPIQGDAAEGNDGDGDGDGDGGDGDGEETP